jgi:hypothetical protein
MKKRLGEKFNCPKCGMYHRPLRKCPTPPKPKVVKTITKEELNSYLEQNKI